MSSRLDERSQKPDCAAISSATGALPAPILRSREIRDGPQHADFNLNRRHPAGSDRGQAERGREASAPMPAALMNTAGDTVGYLVTTRHPNVRYIGARRVFPNGGRNTVADARPTNNFDRVARRSGSQFTERFKALDLRAVTSATPLNHPQYTAGYISSVRATSQTNSRVFLIPGNISIPAVGPESSEQRAQHAVFREVHLLSVRGRSHPAPSSPYSTCFPFRPSSGYAKAQDEPSRSRSRVLRSPSAHVREPVCPSRCVRESGG